MNMASDEVLTFDTTYENCYIQFGVSPCDHHAYKSVGQSKAFFENLDCLRSAESRHRRCKSLLQIKFLQDGLRWPAMFIPAHALIKLLNHGYQVHLSALDRTLFDRGLQK